jgi:hypothetical protein
VRRACSFVERFLKILSFYALFYFTTVATNAIVLLSVEIAAVASGCLSNNFVVVA